MSNQDLAEWIAHDPSDFAQCVREAIAPSIAELAAKIRQFEAIAPKPDRWVMYMCPEMYSRLLPRSRQKMQPYVRKAWRSRQ